MANDPNPIPYPIAPAPARAATCPVGPRAPVNEIRAFSRGGVTRRTPKADPIRPETGRLARRRKTLVEGETVGSLTPGFPMLGGGRWCSAVEMEKKEEE